MSGFFAFAGVCIAGVLLNALLRWCDGKPAFGIDGVSDQPIRKLRSVTKPVIGES